VKARRSIWRSLRAIGIAMLVAHRAAAAEFTLWPNAQIYGGYNNNIGTTSGNAKGDFLSAISPGVTLETDTTPRDFYLTYQTLVLTYLNYTNEDRFGSDNSFGLRDFERLSPDTSLTVNDSFLRGNAISGGLMINGSTPVGAQLLQTLLNQSTSTSNNVNVQLSSRLSETSNAAASVYQNLFIAPSTSVSQYSFGQGGTLSAERLIGENFSAGFSYQFSDYRFSGGDVPTTDTHWPQLQIAWGQGTPFGIRAQAGPVISSSSSGLLGSSPVHAKTAMDAGYLLNGSYTGRRLTVSISGGEQPSLSSGFAGFSTAQTYSFLAQYRLTRLAMVYSNIGYYTSSGTGFNDRVASYSIGASYRLSRIITLNASYFGYQTEVGGSTPTSTGSATSGTTKTNVFLLGLTVTPEPLRLNY
jgi:hypothetical protein